MRLIGHMGLDMDSLWHGTERPDPDLQKILSSCTGGRKL